MARLIDMESGGMLDADVSEVRFNGLYEDGGLGARIIIVDDHVRQDLVLSRAEIVQMIYKLNQVLDGINSGRE